MQQLYKATIFLISVFFIQGLEAQNTESYKLPPQQIIELVDAPSTPGISIGVKAGKFLIMDASELPSLRDLSSEELRLAGIRIDPATNGPSRASYRTGLRLMDLDGKNEQLVQGLPENPQIRNILWSPDEKFIAFTNTTDTGIELWLLELATAKAKPLTGALLNEVLLPVIKWMPDSKSLLYKSIPHYRGDVPKRSRTASEPVIQESYGRKAAVRTFQDLLKDQEDAAIFKYYATSVLMQVYLDGNQKPLISDATLTGNFDPSPDGNYILVNTYKEPFSYIVPYSRFPQEYLLYDMNGKLVKQLASIPVADNLPQGFDATRTGMRSPQWRSDAAASLFWVEATDNGDPAAKASVREQVYFLKAPFDGAPIASAKLELRFGGLSWGKDDFAIVTEYWRKDRRTRSWAFHPGMENPELRLIHERSSEDRYNDPGRFQFVNNAQGREVLQFNKKGDQLFLFGQGASPEGNRPFVDSYQIKSGKTSRLWQSEAPYYEMAVNLIDADQLQLLTRRESVDEQPNYFLRQLKRNRLQQLTFFPDPMPALRKLQQQLIHYERADGVPLSGTLYLPEGFEMGVDAPLPTLLWAYPTEYKSADAAGQVSGSPYQFTRVGASSPVLLATLGYAVLNNASFPIVGEGDEEPNDSFVPQLVANAEAAIHKLVAMGVTDAERVAVSGHSYGAFMTANLLTHSTLFAAGIARSGAYNRTLTPFGFQGEERTYWQAPETYNTMSPFMNAEKMKTPLLLIHGAEDNNSGTFPIQTERYYDALRGLGAPVRMVMLPHESHGYRARESVLHMHYEWIQWLEKYLK